MGTGCFNLQQRDDNNYIKLSNIINNNPKFIKTESINKIIKIQRN